MNHSTCVRLVRTLADGEDRFLTALERTPALDPAAWEAFLSHHKLLEWVAPALTSERGRASTAGRLEERLRAQMALRPARNTELLRESVEVRAALSSAGIECLYLKGLYFARRFYPDASRRHQGDIDLLVRAHALEPALGLLASLGYDTASDADTGRSLDETLAAIRQANPQKAPHGVTVRRGATKLDLHWCLSSRSIDRIAEAPLWNARRRIELSGHEFETLGDEHALAFLLLSLCADLRRGASRAKQFLDLYLILRALAPAPDWEAFFAQRRRERVERACANVLVLFVCLWGCADEFPQLARSLAARRHLLELRDGEEALRLVERPRGNRENRAWFRRVYPRSLPRFWAWRLTRDLPHTLARRRPSYARALL